MSPRHRDGHSSSHVTASSLRALASVGFQPVGVVVGNSTTHIARPVGVGLDSRVSTFSRSFWGDRGAEDRKRSARNKLGGWARLREILPIWRRTRAPTLPAGEHSRDSG
jgi:hypothetical protein